MDKKSSRCHALSQTDRFDETGELHRINNENINKITYLSKTLEQKDDLIKLLLREKSILQCEKDLLQKEQLSAVRDKESIVMRFAIVEKNVIDLKSQLEQAEKREKKILKECDTLNNRVKAAKDEKMRINAALDVKCQEHIHCLRDIETLKTEISSLETKCRWNTVKLRKEIECKHALEKELQELQKNLENNQKPETDECSSHKVAELKQACMCAENNKLHQENLNLQNLLDNNVMKVAELQAKMNDLEALRAQLSISKDANCNLTEHIQYVQKQLTELTDDINKFQKREYELLALNQELGSLNAKLQNDILLHVSKSQAASLENNEANKTQYECQINKLQEELDSERKDRFEERLVMAKHFAEKSKECDNLQQKLNQALEDMTVIKRKHAMLVKDLQREIASLQKSSLLQQITESQQEEQIKSSVTTEDCMDRVDVYEEKVSNKEL
ncbi:coiled-coil domain-containing protein 186 [Ochlerotatus camptorhynchus]|uniref:coiled-coil domain-containing protein 186 n=1 Tax=Ochlerotatus camptorhynchus TaxID=644619 RepID=UPI0031DE45AE